MSESDVNRIPVGYFYKHAMDVKRNDVLEKYGEVLDCTLVQNIILTDSVTEEEYIGDGICVTTPSLKEGFVLEYMFGFYERVGIMQYVDISDDDTLDSLDAFEAQFNE